MDEPHFFSEQAKPCVLMADDCEDDTFFLKSSLVETGVRLPIKVFSNGKELLQFVTEDKEHYPVLVITDLDMPRTDGKQVLSSLKTHPRFKQLPAIVYSGNSSVNDIKECYLLGARSFIPKTGSSEELRRIAAKIKRIWVDPALERLGEKDAEA